MITPKRNESTTTRLDSGIDLLKIIEITKGMADWSNANVEQRLSTAERFAPQEKMTSREIRQLEELQRDLSDDAYFCRAAGIDYQNVGERESRRIKAALAHYITTTF